MQANLSNTGRSMERYIESNIADSAYPDAYTDLRSQISKMDSYLAEVSGLLGGGAKQLLLLAHPIGCYYWSSDPTSPETLFGGKWEQVRDRFVYAAGSKAVGTTGGEEAHTLTVAEMPQHNHTVNNLAYHSTGGTTNVHRTQYDSSKNSQGWVFTNNTGESKAHNNMPPYVTAYCWRRTE